MMFAIILVMMILVTWVIIVIFNADVGVDGGDEGAFHYEDFS